MLISSNVNGIAEYRVGFSDESWKQTNQIGIITETSLPTLKLTRGYPRCLQVSSLYKIVELCLQKPDSKKSLKSKDGVRKWAK